jgi:hypothetical protein
MSANRTIAWEDFSGVGLIGEVMCWLGCAIASWRPGVIATVLGLKIVEIAGSRK